MHRRCSLWPCLCTQTGVRLITRRYTYRSHCCYCYCPSHSSPSAFQRDGLAQQTTCNRWRKWEQIVSGCLSWPVSWQYSKVRIVCTYVCTCVHTYIRTYVEHVFLVLLCVPVTVLVASINCTNQCQCCWCGYNPTSTQTPAQSCGLVLGKRPTLCSIGSGEGLCRALVIFM